MTKNEAHPQEPWSVQDARDLYLIERWGVGYFDINDQGRVVAKPRGLDSPEVPIVDVIDLVRSKGLHIPLLIRFQDILRHRVQALNEAFARAFIEADYQGEYCGVFPVKVNQLREVVEEILDAGKPYGFGLEVGSRPELFAAMAADDRQDGLIICNGYKDAPFIRMALMGIKLGKRVIMVIEKLEELHQIIAISKEIDVRPMIGIRARLFCRGAGKWAESGGDNAKFGLNTAEILVATRRLEREGLSDCLKLLHFHIGSQVPDITIIKRAVQEAARIYAKLHQAGSAIEYFDVGGGLGVDYDGSRTDFESSTNYNLQEYANDVVFHLGEVCRAESVPYPKIVSESGRALVAHHSVLVVEVMGAVSKTVPTDDLPPGESSHPLVQQLEEIQERLPSISLMEAYHDAVDIREKAHSMFLLGMLELSDKARIENLYWTVGRKIVERFRGQDYVPEEIGRLEGSLGDQYICNFSVFQSLLDHWALDQLFPIMPLDRNTERPGREATLVDITCDSDGQIKKFIDLHDTRETLLLHELPKRGSQSAKDGEPPRYYLGFFLMGAYQDIMGDLHNLFGPVNEAHVFLDEDESEGYYIEEVIHGDTVSDVLEEVQYDVKELVRRMKRQVNDAIKSDRIKPREGMQLLEDYERGLKDYPYLRLIP